MKIARIAAALCGLLSAAHAAAPPLALPTYAATAWYHKKLPGAQSPDLPKFLAEVEHFATHEYALALEQGAARLDTRFSRPSLDPLSKGSEYDPQSAAVSSAYISIFNDYARPLPQTPSLLLRRVI